MTIRIGSPYDRAKQEEYRLFEAALTAQRAGNWEASRRLIVELEKQKDTVRQLAGTDD